MSRVIKKICMGLVGCALLGGFASAARADIIVTLPSTTPTPAGAGFVTFSYTADLTNDEKLQAGNYFTIYDIPGLSTAVGPAGWTETTQNTGKTPGLTNPPDNSSIPNVTFTYTGANTGAGPLNLGTFSITTDTAHGSTSSGFYAAEATGAVSANLGQNVDNASTVPVPAGPASATPLPMAAYAILPALLLASLYGRRLVRCRA